MRAENTELEKKIRTECLNLLLEKESELIGMRDIASACGVSSTSIYYYFKDKEMLFEAVKLDCIASLDTYVFEKTLSLTDPVDRIRTSLSAFRDWSFENPRKALLVMGRLKANVNAESNEMAQYYRSTEFAKNLLDQAVSEGKSKSKNTLLDCSLCIAGVWGAIESILLKRTVPEYWSNGVFFTDRMIELCCSAIF